MFTIIVVFFFFKPTKFKLKSWIVVVKSKPRKHQPYKSSYLLIFMLNSEISEINVEIFMCCKLQIPHFAKIIKLHKLTSSFVVKRTNKNTLNPSRTHHVSLFKLIRRSSSKQLILHEVTLHHTCNWQAGKNLKDQLTNF